MGRVAESALCQLRHGNVRGRPVGSQAVRALAILVLVSGPAVADPETKKPDKQDLMKALEPLPHNQVVVPTDRTPGVSGADALGRVLRPDDHPDSALWPNGMVIVPPDTGDQMVLIPGTLQLPWWRPVKRGPVSKEVLDGIEGGVGTLLEWLVPPGT
jgi:hypothetical protein